MSVIIFDFDGTIANTLPILVKIFNETAPEFNLSPLTFADIEKLRNFSASELLKKYPITPIKLAKVLFTFQSKLKSELSQLKIFPGIREVIKELQKQKHLVGIVTSNSAEIVNLFLEKEHLTSINFLHSEKNIFGKGRILKKILAKNKWNKNEVFYVGDEVRDREAASQAGIRMIAVTWGFNSGTRLRKSHPDFIVDTPKELLKKLFTFQSDLS